jgi:hypothetical protein
MCVHSPPMLVLFYPGLFVLEKPTRHFDENRVDEDTEWWWLGRQKVGLLCTEIHE